MTENEIILIDFIYLLEVDQKLFFIFIEIDDP
jgi:hypothetical protein